MLITEKVNVKWHGNNREWYENSGYIFTKTNDEFEVKCEDLMHGCSSVKVKVKCDCESCKNPYLKPMKWSNYIIHVKEDGTYCCQKCIPRTHNTENTVRTKLLKSGSIAETNPSLIKYFVNLADTKKYSAYSNKKVPMKCPDCGFEKNMKITTLTRQGFSCSKCGDGISYPEKFFFNVLEQLEIEFLMQLTKTTFEWCGNYRYDFYIPYLNIIIETHGKQHYEKSGFPISLEVEQENDKNKYELALKNDIKKEKYIIIDCRESDLEFIKNSILMSELGKLFNLSNIDWLKCNEYACGNLMKTVCDMWTNNIQNAANISHSLKLHISTVKTYLKQGNKLGWCNYNGKEQMLISSRKLSISIICITTGEIFQSITQAFNKYNISIGNIVKCCQGKRNYCGKNPKNGEDLRWMYFEDYIKINKDLKEAI